MCICISNHMPEVTFSFLMCRLVFWHGTHMVRESVSPAYRIFKASALLADAFYKSKCPSVCVSVRPSVCVFTFEVLFNGLFAPPSRSRMSHIFRDSESLGESNGKKRYNIWTFLFGSGLKCRAKNSFFFADFALQNMVETTLHDGLETSGRRAYR